MKKKNYFVLTGKVICICFLFGCAFFYLDNRKVLAADFPEKDILCIVPDSAGSQPDLAMRAIIPFVQERLKVVIRVENLLGVATKIGMTKIAKSKADGYTIGAITLPKAVITEVVYETDYKCSEVSHIYAWVVSDSTLLVHKDGPKNIGELVQLSKSKTLTAGTGAYGGGPHLSTLIMTGALGINARIVHFDNTAQANTGLAGGHVDFTIGGISPTSISMIQRGLLKPLLIMADQRNPDLPDVPTQKDLGYSFKTIASLEGAIAPSGMPPDRLRLLQNAFYQAGKDPRFVKWAKESKTQIIHLEADSLRQKIIDLRSQVDKYRNYMKPK